MAGPRERERERGSENLDLKYKVNGDLLLLIRTDLPYGNTSRQVERERERGEIRKGGNPPRVYLKTEPQLDEYLKVFHCV